VPMQQDDVASAAGWGPDARRRDRARSPTWRRAPAQQVAPAEARCQPDRDLLRPTSSRPLCLRHTSSRGSPAPSNPLRVTTARVRRRAVA
jgi:hypothetical protein